MRAGLVVATSAIAHGAVLAALAQWATTRPPLPTPVRARVDEPLIEVTVVPSAPASPAIELAEIPAPRSVEPLRPAAAVAALPGRAVPAVATRERPTSALPPAGAAALRATDPAAAARSPLEPPAAPGDATSPRAVPLFGPTSTMLHMRAPLVGESPAALAPIAERGDRPSEPIRSGRLDNAPGGRGVIHDRVTTVTVDRDGSAHLHDAADIDIHVTIPRPLIALFRLDFEQPRHDLGELITDWYRDPYAGTRFGRSQDLARHLQAVEGGCSSFGDVMCDDALAPGIDRKLSKYSGGVLPVLGGALDITGWLMRKVGNDAYSARKLALLDATRDERAARGAEFRADQLAHADEIMRKHLTELWAATADPIARKEALFELWDDCAEAEGPVGEAGERARRTVIGWIRGHLPADSADAFTPSEIAAMSARKSSKQAFAPYEP